MTTPQTANAGAVDSSELLARLEAIYGELYQYAYGKDKHGERYLAWHQISFSADALEVAMAEIWANAESSDGGR